LQNGIPKSSVKGLAFINTTPKLQEVNIDFIIYTASSESSASEKTKACIYEKIHQNPEKNSPD